MSKLFVIHIGSVYIHDYSDFVSDLSDVSSSEHENKQIISWCTTMVIKIRNAEPVYRGIPVLYSPVLLAFVFKVQKSRPDSEGFKGLTEASKKAKDL